jgi:hypothetical protein
MVMITGTAEPDATPTLVPCGWQGVVNASPKTAEERANSVEFYVSQWRESVVFLDDGRIARTLPLSKWSDSFIKKILGKFQRRGHGQKDVSKLKRTISKEISRRKCFIAAFEREGENMGRFTSKYGTSLNSYELSHASDNKKRRLADV